MIRLYLQSPAAEALELAARALPVIDIPVVTDPAPLMSQPTNVMPLAQDGEPNDRWPAAGLSALVVLGCVGVRIMVNRS